MESVLVSFLIVILTCYTTHTAELLVGSSPDQNFTRNLIPCDNDSDCETFINGECRNDFCECNGTKFCEDKVGITVSKIGEFCNANGDCNIEHSVCKEHKCACAEGRVDTSDGRRCLKIADSLGSTCEKSIQCYKKVPHSGCQNEKCVCQQQMHEYEGACYADVALGGACQQPGNCSVTPFARCIDHKCTCKPGYVQNRAGNRCMDLPTKIGGLCYEDIQCSLNFGKAVCKEGHCHCAELYKFKMTKLKCVGNLLLGEPCQNHTDCRGADEGESRSECILEKCRCKSEFIEEDGYCTSGEMSSVCSPILFLFSLVALIMRML